jgi:predicted DNA-binding protein (UPF0251 family)
MTDRRALPPAETMLRKQPEPLEPTAPPPVVRREKTRVIPKRLKEAIELLQRRGMTITAAAERVGMARETLSRTLGEEHVRKFYHQKAERAVAVAKIRASARVGELLDSESDKVSLDAAKHVLGIAGISPKNDARVSVNIELKAGYVLDLREPGDERPMKIVSPDPAEIPAPADEQT